MKTILLSFLIITNQPTTPSPREATLIARGTVQKMNTLRRGAFRLGHIYFSLDPFPSENDGYFRLAKLNRFVKGKYRRDNWVGVIDRAQPDLGGVAYQCQKYSKKGVAAVVFQRKENTVAFTIAALAHEFGHMLGFAHVRVWLDSFISIMDFDLFNYQKETKVSRFRFYDPISALWEFGCRVNQQVGR